MPQRYEDLARQLGGPTNLASQENQSYIDEAIRRKLAAQQAGVGFQPTDRERAAMGSQMTDRERALMQRRRRPSPKLDNARQMYRQRVMNARKRRPKESAADIATSLFGKLKSAQAEAGVGTQMLSDPSKMAGEWASPDPRDTRVNTGPQAGVPVTGFTLPEGAVGYAASMPSAIRQQFPDVPPGAYFELKDLTRKERLLLRRLQALSAQERAGMQGQMGQ